MALRFSVRTLLLVMVLLAGTLAALLGVQQIIAHVEQEAFRDAYERGTVTKEGARRVVGDVVDSWPPDSESSTKY